MENPLENPLVKYICHNELPETDKEQETPVDHYWKSDCIGVRAGGARGAAAPPKFGQLRFFGQQEKIWAKPLLKTSPCLFNYFEDLNINLKSA